MSRLSAQSSVHTGADYGRARGNWRPSSGSADADLLYELPTLRARARDMGRNGIGAGVLRTMVDHVVGERGIRAQSRIDPEVFAGDRDQARQAQREIEAAIEAWSRCVDVACRMDWPAVQRIMFRSLLENGDVLVHLVPGILPGPQSDLAIELIEADRLETPLRQSQNELFRAGVEYDARGIPRAYHVLRVHPGELHRLSFDNQRIQRWNSAGRPNALHVFEELRVGQSRGVPFFAPVLADFDHRGDFKEAELYAGRLNAYLAVAITKEQGYEEAVARTEGQEDSDGRRIEEFDHGMVEYLQAGEDVKLIDPKRPGSNAETFLKITDSDIGAALGIPIELIRKDFRENTWHSARQSSLELERSTKGWQAMMIRQAVGPIIEMVVENAILRGECPAIDSDTFAGARGDILRFRWSLATRGLVDPGQENAASETGLRLNLTTLADECAARGRDYEEVIEQRAREREMEIEAGPLEDETEKTQPSEAEADPNLAFRNAVDTYGIGVRAGVITPQTTDEDHFRRMFGLPAASGDVRKAWGKDQGTRRPITITPAAGATVAPAFGKAVPPAPPAQDPEPETEDIEEGETDV